MSAAREERHELIRTLVRARPMRTQNELANALREHGCAVTQATVSRDIADLNLQKDAQGAYALSEDLRLHTAARSSMRETRRAGNQIVVLTEPGSAPSVAAAIDASCAQGVLGTIAGDDTILLICADEEAAGDYQEHLDGLLS